MQVFNESYKTNLLNIKNLVLVMFENDTMVIPRESAVSVPFYLCKIVIALLIILVLLEHLRS